MSEETPENSNNSKIKSFRQKTREQEERIAQLPKVTFNNPFPEHKHPSQKELEKYQGKPDPKSLRQRPQGGCDY